MSKLDELPESFEALSTEDVRAALGELKPSVRAQTSLKFYEGDHWQEGGGYRGPLPNKVEFADEAALVLTALEREWTSENKIKEVANRHRSGVVGRPPFVHIAPERVHSHGESGEEPVAPGNQDVTLLTKMLTEWMSRPDVAKAIIEAVTTALLTDAAPLRFYIPPTLLDVEGRLFIAGENTDALENIFLEAPKVGEAGVISHPVTKQKLGIFHRRNDEGNDYFEWCYRNMGEDDIRYAVRDGDKVDDVRLPLARQLPIYLLERPSLISEQMQSLQRQLNLAVTMRGRNVTAAGFVERTLLNAKVSTRRVTKADGKIVDEPVPLVFGSGVTNNIVGVETQNADTSTSRATPGIVYRDPAGPEAFNGTRDSAYRGILEEAHQIHYLIAGDAAPSGESRIAAMADHITALLETKKAVDLMLTWVVRTATAYLELLTDRPGHFTDRFQISAECKLDSGPISTEMMRTVMELVSDELLSRRSGMGWIGIEDVEGEEEQIAQERSERSDGMVGTAADRLKEMLAGRRNGQGAENDQA